MSDKIPIKRLLNMPAIEVELRVKLIDEWDCLPDFIAKAGATGTITMVDLALGNEMVRVKMDEIIEGCEEWDNEIVLTSDNVIGTDMRFDHFFWAVFEKI